MGKRQGRSHYEKLTKAQLIDRLSAVEDALEAIGDGFILFDAEDRVVACNSKHRQLFPSVADCFKPGVSHSELLRLQVESGRFEAARGREEAWIEERIRQHRNPDRPVEQRFSDGRVIQLREHKTPSGGIVAIRTDITDLKRTQKKLRESEKRFRDFAESSADWLWEVDANSVFSYMSPSCEKYSGLAAREIIGRTRAELYARVLPHFDEEEKRLWSLVNKHIEDQKPYRDLQLRWIRPDGEERIFITNGKPVFSDNGEYLGFRGVGQDVTERVRAERMAREARARLLDAIENISEAFVLYDTDDRLVLCNDKFRNLYPWAHDLCRPGTRFEDLIRSGIAAGMYPEAKNREKDYLADRLAEHRDIKGTYLQRLNDGRWLQIRNRRTSEGYIAGTRTDVTEIKQREQNFKNLQARFRAMLSIAPEAIIVAGSDMRIQIFNHGAEKLFGFDAAEVVDRPMDILIPHAARAGHDEHIEAFLAAKEDRLLITERGAIAGLRKDGSEFPAEASVSKLDVGDDTIFIVMLHDITERKCAEANLIRAKEQAEFADRAKSEFLANMSHELRTPLNAVIGFSSVMAEETFGPIGKPRYRQYAVDIRDSGEHLLAIINDILDLSRIETGNIQLSEDIVDVAKTLLKCGRMIEARAAESDVKLAMKIAAPVPRIRADERMLRQMLLNLLSNAVKFTRPGGCVTVSAKAGDDGCLTLSIADTGIGIAEEDLPKALAPFGQVDGALDRKFEGAGLGLTLVKSLVELHGGKLKIDSRVNVGTTAILWFPRERVVVGG